MNLTTWKSDQRDGEKPGLAAPLELLDQAPPDANATCRLKLPHDVTK